MKIITADLRHLETIHRIAKETWPIAYKNVISDEQIDFMLSKMYSILALEQQMEEGHVFVLLKTKNSNIGFASYSKDAKSNGYKLQKLYLHPKAQGKGAGKTLIEEVEKRVKDLGAEYLYLNVNRGNKAYGFYKKMGYDVFEEIDIPYYSFILDDYIMRKKL
ncbi:GNAT family N-acetyltransferase [Pedobacter sp. SD-b]|uniref:GNAT family N-acetyltransferase n=1 Tax=Pedobacter segetis TaxID=2793069 RepID=A0ABS1BEX3_9SPHI|nr:GNAT family N-acetyltransferase [Pedobacter segetis]MBK0381407.1 GNAT family N-acetyltransferase [Pedobacter segetis]